MFESWFLGSLNELSRYLLGHSLILLVAPVGWGRFLMVPHLFADPIDSIWGLLAKVEGWRRCYRIARELYADWGDKDQGESKGDDGESERKEKTTSDVAVIIAAIEELFEQARESDEVGDVEQGRLQSSSRVAGFEMNRMKTASTGPKFPGHSITTLEVRQDSITPGTNPPRPRSTPFSLSQTPFCSCQTRALTDLYAKTAQRVLDHRAIGTLQTIFSIGVYIVGTLAAFIPAFGGNSNPSGGKIASSMILSWLLPTVLLSNIVGHWNSPRDVLDAVLEFKEELERLENGDWQGPHRSENEKGEIKKGDIRKDRKLPHRRAHANSRGDQPGTSDPSNSLIPPTHTQFHSPTCTSRRMQNWLKAMRAQNWTPYSEHLSRTGSIYSFRLNKRLPQLISTDPSTRPHRTYNHSHLVILSLLPVFVSFVSTFIVLWSPPTYFSCRHFMIIGIFCAWLFSSVLTSLPHILSRFDVPAPLSRSRAWMWKAVTVKDVTLSIAIVTLLVLSASGLFNSCWCWTGWYWLHWFAKDPQVQLNPDIQFIRNDGLVYPITVALTLLLQGVIFGMWCWVGRDVYFGMMRREEREKWKTVLRGRGKQRVDDEERGLVKRKNSSVEES
jgi:hypothetical protein